MKLITRDTDYALSALVELARAPGRTLSAAALSTHLDISHAFLRRILQNLASSGVVASRRGPAGGFTLNGDPGAITVRGIAELFQGPVRVSGCGGDCSRSARCVLRHRLTELESRLVSDLMAITLASLSGNARTTAWPSPPPRGRRPATAAPRRDPKGRSS